jgi:hypothetical protein
VGTKQPQVGLLCQILYIHARTHSPPQELEKAPVPTLPPFEDERPILHA